MRRASSFVVTALLLAGCNPEEIVNPAGARIEGYRQVVPFAAPPAGVETQNANNNLDVVRHEGRVYLAFRTAPSHFASAETVLFVVSSEDQETWRYETHVTMGTDLREMRFLSLEGKLVLYFAVLGSNPLDFEPQGMMAMTYEGGAWSEPAPLYEPGFIPWRAKVIDGSAYLVGYVGGENIYDFDGEPIRIHLLRTEDGLTFEPLVPDRPVVQEGGGSETDFVFLANGDLVAVVRNEAGDALGFGSKICRAKAADLGAWDCKPDKKKYDSPLLFRSGDDVWLIGRRNLTETGNFDLDRDDLSLADQAGVYAVEYSFQPKRCSLWRVDPETLSVTFELDLPSRGDTCFASIVPAGEGSYDVYNYTSPLDGGDEPRWIEGQGGPTLIYRVRLDVPR